MSKSPKLLENLLKRGKIFDLETKNSKNGHRQRSNTNTRFFRFFFFVCTFTKFCKLPYKDLTFQL